MQSLNKLKQRVECAEFETIDSNVFIHTVICSSRIKEIIILILYLKINPSNPSFSKPSFPVWGKI